MDVPLAITLIVIATAAAVVVATAAVLNRAPVDISESHRRSIALTVGAALLGWLVAAVLLALAGAFQQLGGVPRVIYPLIAVPVIGIVASRTISPLRRLLDQPRTQSRVVTLHVWRVAGGVFLIMAALGRLPLLFALPAGLGDIALAIMAPTVARRMNRGTGRQNAIMWNVFGLLDLVVAVGLGATTSPGILQVFHTNPSSYLLGGFPLVLYPIFLVPVAILMHVVSLRFLLREPAQQDRDALPARTTYASSGSG
jgi:hypothetical protein